MKLRQLTLLTAFVSLFSASVFAGDITYNQYTGHENRVSSTVFEFDVYLQATGAESFKLRSVQNAFTFNSAFINGATILVAYVPGSSAIPGYSSTLKWSNAGNGFNSSASLAGTCATNGIIVPLAPASVKVGTYRLTCVSGQFGNVAPKVNFVKQGQADPAADMLLKAAVSRWDDINCMKGSATAVPFKEAAQSTDIANGSMSTVSPSLWPNPANGKTTLSFTTPKADKYVVKIFDATGHLVMTESIAAAQGYNSKEFNLTGKAAGRYTMSIQTSDTDKESLQLIIE